MAVDSKTPRSSRPIWIFLGFMVMMGGLMVWKTTQSGPKGAGGPPGGPGKGAPVRVSAFVAGPSPLPITLEIPGTLLPWREVQIAPEMAGRVVTSYLEEGKNVAKGDVLLVLNDQELLAQKSKIETQIRLAQKTLSRYGELLAVKGISQQEIDQAENQVETLQADLRLLEANLVKTRIRAPFSGTLGFSDIQEGAFLNPGQVISRIQDIAALKLEFSVPEKYLNEIRMGDQVHFSLESQPDTFAARVFALDPGIDPATRSLRIRARFENKAGLKAGSFARTEVLLGQEKSALLIPTQAIIPDTRGKKVIRVKNGAPEFVPVETGIRKNESVQITKGLMAGDTILTTGLMFVRPGSAIHITKTEQIAR